MFATMNPRLYRRSLNYIRARSTISNVESGIISLNHDNHLPFTCGPLHKGAYQLGPDPGSEVHS